MNGGLVLIYLIFRSLLISSNYLNKQVYVKELDKNLYSVIDELQNVLDRNKICSEVHMIFKNLSKFNQLKF